MLRSRVVSSITRFLADEVQDAWLEVMGATPAVPRSEDFNDYLVVNWVDYDARLPLQMWHGISGAINLDLCCLKVCNK